MKKAKKVKMDETFLTVMVPDVEAKRKEIDRIANICFHHFIQDTDMLAVALYAGNIFEAVCCVHSAPGSVPQMAAEKAKEFHFNMDKIQKAARSGYFEKNIEKLLELGESNADYGAKLVQVFWCFLDHIQEHRLSKALVKKMNDFIMTQGWMHGFIIKYQLNNEIHERFFVKGCAVDEN